MNSPENLLIIEQFVRKCNLILSDTSALLADCERPQKPTVSTKKRLQKLEFKEQNDFQEMTQDMIDTFKSNCTLVLTEVNQKVQAKLRPPTSKA
jgi:hypothetical protein